MSYNFEKKMSTDARKAANTTFGLIGALIGLAFGGRSSGRVTRRRPSGSQSLGQAPGACGINSNSTRKIWKYE